MIMSRRLNQIKEKNIEMIRDIQEEKHIKYLYTLVAEMLDNHN